MKVIYFLNYTIMINPLTDTSEGADNLIMQAQVLEMQKNLLVIAKWQLRKIQNYFLKIRESCDQDNNALESLPIL